MALSTPWAMSGDCEPIETLTPQDAPSKPFFDESYPMLRIVSRTMLENAVADLVSDLVRVAFRDRLGGEQAACHGAPQIRRIHRSAEV
jgi:hypothetical protein